jgi:hypothetical protein
MPPAGRLGAKAEATAMAAERESARSILTVRWTERCHKGSERMNPSSSFVRAILAQIEILIMRF